MTKILDPTQIMALEARGIFQNPTQPAGYGINPFGNSFFGAENTGEILAGFGLSVFGNSYFGAESSGADVDVIIPTGIYQMRKCKEGKIPIRINLYNYVITHTEAQQTNREKFADAVVAWQGLTSSEKLLYNERAKTTQMSGYNLFLKEYLRSH